MDFAFEEPREERLIEEYLFHGYKPSGRLTHDPDHQFAKPIQDEDLFAVEQPEVDNSSDSVSLDSQDPEKPAFSDYLDDQSLGLGDFNSRENNPLCDPDLNKSPTHLFDDDDEIVELQQSGPCKQYNNSRPNIDEIFLDDFSESSYPTNNENLQPPVEQSISAIAKAASIRAKKALFMERLKEQAEALALKPKPLEKETLERNTLDFVIEQERLVSDTQSKFIFNKIFNRSKKARDTNDTPEKKAKSWNEYRDTLTKRMCSQKRKVWDTFNKNSDHLVDEEEEFVEQAPEGDEEEPQDDELVDQSSADKGRDVERQDEVEIGDVDIDDEVEDADANQMDNDSEAEITDENEDDNADVDEDDYSDLDVFEEEEDGDEDDDDDDNRTNGDKDQFCDVEAQVDSRRVPRIVESEDEDEP